MSWQRLPSLNALRAFCTTAETGSLSAAGVKLNVTHAAVSQQIKSLEEHLGTTLLLRQGRGIKLTPDGEQLAKGLSIGFGTIQRAVGQIQNVEDSRPVQVSTSPAFAVAWLMPRLVDFQAAHPDITLLINPTVEKVDLKLGGIDLAVRYTSRPNASLELDTVLVSDMVVVATPDLLGEKNTEKPHDLLCFPWLQELNTNEVLDWFASHNVPVVQPPMISHMPGNLIMQAVRRGDGLTYTARPFVDEEIRTGRLRELFCDPQHGVYYLLTRPGIVRAPVRKFIKWMHEQAEQDGQVGALLR